MKSASTLILPALIFLVQIASTHAADDSPLHKAVQAGDKAQVEALLAKGADVNAKDNSGGTPLHRAAYYGKKDVAELLIIKGADVNAKDNSGGTPLHRAANEGRKDVVELLIIKGADVNAKAKDGQTPLHRLASAGRKDVVELLIIKGADVNAKANNGWTPLHRAAYYGEKDVAELLLAKGADVNAKDNDGETPLLWAAMEGQKDIVELLLAKGADVNAKGKYGSTPLARATYGGKKKDIAELLENHIVQRSRNPRAAIVQLTAQLKDKPDDTSTRRLIIKLASGLKPAPAIPEEARKHFVEGTAIVKAAKNPAQQALAAQSFGEALKIAPWWGDAYYNLGVAQELAENYDEAEKAFNFYLLTNPSAAEKREVQDRIYALSAKRKLLGAK